MMDGGAAAPRSSGKVCLIGIRRSGAMPKPACFLLALLLTLLLLPSARAADIAPLDFFEKEVRPLLVAKCLDCHGVKKSKAGLRLTSREEVLKGGDSGAAAVP